jgi:hypothetical protein
MKTETATWIYPKDSNKFMKSHPAESGLLHADEQTVTKILQLFIANTLKKGNDTVVSLIDYGLCCYKMSRANVNIR